jgi:hypothetical protein
MRVSSLNHTPPTRAHTTIRLWRAPSGNRCSCSTGRRAQEQERSSMISSVLTFVCEKSVTGGRFACNGTRIVLAVLVWVAGASLHMPAYAGCPTCTPGTGPNYIITIPGGNTFVGNSRFSGPGIDQVLCSSIAPLDDTGFCPPGNLNAFTVIPYDNSLSTTVQLPRPGLHRPDIRERCLVRLHSRRGALSPAPGSAPRQQRKVFGIRVSRLAPALRPAIKTPA